MGFNTLMVIRNKDLPAIAEDPNFGEAIRLAVVFSESNVDDRPFGQAFRSSSLDAERCSQRGYDIQCARSHHASNQKIHVVKNGDLATLGYMSQPDWNLVAAGADAFSKLGYRIERKGHGAPWHAKKSEIIDHIAAERDWMHGFDQQVFDEGSTAFLVLNDALREIREEKDFGKIFVRELKKWWIYTKDIFDLHAANALPPGGEIFVPDAIGAGNHANPIQIVSVVPENTPDLIATGGNWGRVRRPHLSLREARSLDSDHGNTLMMLRKSDLQTMKQSFLEMGFHVRSPDRVRSESPASWAEKYWVTPDQEPEISMEP